MQLCCNHYNQTNRYIVDCQRICHVVCWIHHMSIHHQSCFMFEVLLFNLIDHVHIGTLPSLILQTLFIWWMKFKNVQLLQPVLSFVIVSAHFVFPFFFLNIKVFLVFWELFMPNFIHFDVRLVLVFLDKTVFWSGYLVWNSLIVFSTILIQYSFLYTKSEPLTFLQPILQKKPCLQFSSFT